MKKLLLLSIAFSLAVPALAEAVTAAGEPRDWKRLAGKIAADKVAQRQEWVEHDFGGRVNSGWLFDALRERLADDAIVVADDGNHTFLTAELMPIHAGGAYLLPKLVGPHIAKEMMFLADDWPEGVYPLRKDYHHEANANTGRAVSPDHGRARVLSAVRRG